MNTSYNRLASEMWVLIFTAGFYLGLMYRIDVDSTINFFWIITELIFTIMFVILIEMADVKRKELNTIYKKILTDSIVISAVIQEKKNSFLRSL